MRHNLNTTLFNRSTERLFNTIKVIVYLSKFFEAIRRDRYFNKTIAPFAVINPVHYLLCKVDPNTLRRLESDRYNELRPLDALLNSTGNKKVDFIHTVCEDVFVEWFESYDIWVNEPITSIDLELECLSPDAKNMYDHVAVPVDFLRFIGTINDCDRVHGKIIEYISKLVFNSITGSLHPAPFPGAPLGFSSDLTYNNPKLLKVIYGC